MLALARFFFCLSALLSTNLTIKIIEDGKIVTEVSVVKNTACKQTILYRLDENVQGHIVVCVILHN
jgi:hypothetical protein